MDTQDPNDKLTQDLLEALAKDAKGKKDPFGPDSMFQKLKAAVMERVLDAELTEHLGYDKGSPNTSAERNHRNGHSRKTVKTGSGSVRIKVPRDRGGTFEPQLIPKHARRLAGFDEKVLSLYARGMSTRDIQSHLSELYGTEVSPDLISRATDAVIEEVQAWQTRPLDAVYPIVYLDALFVHVRYEGKVRKKAVYLALGVNFDGQRDVLGMWMEQTEGARFWLSVLTDLRNRGLQDIFFVCCDGLTGFPEAVDAAFPKAVFQTCIVHLLRASLRYVPYGDRRAVAAALKTVYVAENEDAADLALKAFDESWGAKYPLVTKQWRARWKEIVPFLAYPKEIRSILYTTNAIESLNFQIRKVLRPKGHFPNDEAVMKLIFLAIQRGKKHWKAAPNWRLAMAHFAIVFEDRLPA
jgi:putative transposase